MFDTSILDDEEVVAEKEVSIAGPVPTVGAVVTTIDMFDTSILDDEEVVAEKEVSIAGPVPTAGEVVTTVGKDQIMIDEEVTRNLEAQMKAELEEEERLARQREEEANIDLIES
nr:hypothetical protein [Tanacetum cinerariifolium]